MKKIWAMYFSATGTTQSVVNKIAGTLAEQLQLPLEEYDFTLPKKRAAYPAFDAEDLVVFGVPVYAGRVPNVLLKYLNTIQGCGAMAVPVVLFGNRNFDDGLIELRNILKQNGFQVIAAGAFVGEHAFSTILGAGRPDESDVEIAAAFSKTIAEKLQAREIAQGDLVPVQGREPLGDYYQPKDAKGNPVDFRKIKPKTSGDCIDCKICAEVCPMGSIEYEDVSAIPGICIKCGACVKKCPMEAKYYDDPAYLYHKKELEIEFSRRAEPQLFFSIK